MSMILYNIRHRGPYEYDKFTLNILQTYNEVKRLLDSFEKNSSSQLIERQKQLTAYINAMCAEKGILQDIMLEQQEFE